MTAVLLAGGKSSRMGYHPKQQLMLDGESCDDPHVERMIESFAFLAARIHKKIDDDFPQISDALLAILLPHLLRPVPSMSVVQLNLPSNTQLSSLQRIPAGTSLLTRPVKGLPLRYRCSWPVEVAPIEGDTLLARLKSEAAAKL